MLALAERKEVGSTLLEWEPGDETVVPNNHSIALSAFSWDTEDDTVVPGHHVLSATPFSWNEG